MPRVFAAVQILRLAIDADDHFVSAADPAPSPLGAGAGSSADPLPEPCAGVVGCLGIGGTRWLHAAKLTNIAPTKTKRRRTFMLRMNHQLAHRLLRLQCDSRMRLRCDACDGCRSRER